VIPAAPRAGLDDGDEVAAIDGRPALEWNPDELQRLSRTARWARGDDPLAARGKNRTLKVKPEDLL
jgi:hypothetical protein